MEEEEEDAEAAAGEVDDDDPAFIRLDPALKDMFRKNPRLATAYWNIVRTHGLESESSRAAAVAADAAAVAAVGDPRTLETATRGGSLHLRRAGSRRATARGSSSSPSGCGTRTIRACSWRRRRSLPIAR